MDLICLMFFFYFEYFKKWCLGLIRSPLLVKYSVFGVHSALLQVLVGSGHLEVEVLSELLLLVCAAVDRLVGPV